MEVASVVAHIVGKEEESGQMCKIHASRHTMLASAAAIIVLLGVTSIIARFYGRFVIARTWDF